MSFVTDFLFGRDEPAAPVVNVQVPGKTETEQELIRLQTEILQKVSAGSPEEAALMAKTKEYYEQMLAESTLSPEEEAEFDKEYGLQLEALQETFDIETGRYGAKQFADLLSRGMFETTTGERDIALTQEKFAQQLTSTQAEMLESKELAKSDLEAAKRSLSTAGYSLTSGLSQSQLSTALEASMGLQNYYLGQGGLQASASLQNALATQALEKAKYNQRMTMWGGMTSLGTGLMKGGLMYG